MIALLIIDKGVAYNNACMKSNSLEKYCKTYALKKEVPINPNNATNNAFIDEKIIVLFISKSKAASNNIKINPATPSIFSKVFLFAGLSISN